MVRVLRDVVVVITQLVCISITSLDCVTEPVEDGVIVLRLEMLFVWVSMG